MRRRRFVALVVAATSLLAVAGVAVASEAFDGAKSSTARFHDLDQAIAAGYTVRVADAAGLTCIAHPTLGGMGVHMLDPSLLDGAIDADTPEILVYEQRDDGTLKLSALEYLVFQSDWKGAERPALFGRQFDFTGTPNRYGLPAFYSLHAWLWKPNPSGILTPYNPRVTC